MAIDLVSERPLLEYLIGIEFYVKLVATLLLTAGAWIFYVRRENRRLPPGPFPFPIIGNLQMLGDLPHQALAALSLKFGPLMSLRLGSSLTIIVSSPEMAKEIFKNNDLLFSGRPPSLVAKHLYYDSTNIGLAPYGPYWRQMRKVCVSQLLTIPRLHYFGFIREEEVSTMIRSIAASSHQTVNIKKTASTLAINIMCRMAFGRKYSDQDSIGTKGIISLIKEIFYLTGAFNIGDFIPYLRWMDLQGLNRRMKNVQIVHDEFLSTIIEEHVASQTDLDASRDLVDVLLAASADKGMELQITHDNIKAIAFSMLSAGTYTSSTAIEWAMSEVLNNPRVMKKLQEELECVVGMGRMVRETDVPSLVYLQAVVKETLRLHPPGPLALPHASVEACNVLGYEIPKNTRVLVNLWAIGRNSKSWEDAERFVPERFMQAGFADEKIQNCEWIPFGTGRRRCPGKDMGTTVVQIALAQLLQCFEWRLPDGQEELDMSERFNGVDVPRAHELLVSPLLAFHMNSWLSPLLPFHVRNSNYFSYA